MKLIVMKKYVITSIILIILLVGILLLKGKGNVMNEKLVIENTKSFRMFYTMGYAFNSDIRYEYEYKDDEYHVYVKPYGISDEDKKEIVVSSDFIKRIEDVLNKYEVYKWDGFNKSDNNVLDGDSFSIYIDMGEKDISASGYMMYPEHYREVREELDNIFNELINGEE